MGFYENVSCMDDSETMVSSYCQNISWKDKNQRKRRGKSRERRGSAGDEDVLLEGEWIWLHGILSALFLHISSHGFVIKTTWKRLRDFQRQSLWTCKLEEMRKMIVLFSYCVDYICGANK